jgi:CBS domain-containing protein
LGTPSHPYRRGASATFASAIVSGREHTSGRIRTAAVIGRPPPVSLRCARTASRTCRQKGASVSSSWATKVVVGPGDEPANGTLLAGGAIEDTDCRSYARFEMRSSLREVMSRNLLTVVPEDTLGEAAERMAGRDVGAALVMDAGRLVGIVTERDLLGAVAARVQTSEAPVREWMTEKPVTVPEATSIERAASIMVKNGFRHLPISDGERTIGIVSLRDVVRSVVRVYPEYEDDAEGEEE